MKYSKQLSEEIFNQKASMALCSAIDKYDKTNGSCISTSCSSSCGSTTSIQSMAVSSSLLTDYKFQADLKNALSQYNIEASYVLDTHPNKLDNKNVFQCAVTLNNEDEKSYLSLQFPNKKQQVLKNMKLMFITSLIIIIFITLVLLYANWTLIKQKKLLQRNIDFFNNVAHEFRTPLSNIGLATNLLLKKENTHNQNEYLQIIKKENANLQHEIEHILQLASVEHLDFNLQHEVISLKELINQTVADFDILMHQKKVILHIDPIDPNIEIHCDKTLLKRVFKNLIDNGIKYNQNTPEITIKTKMVENNHVQILFIDNGIGIPQENSELIFEKFQRATHTETHNYKGFGLGLAYVKRMIEMHKGKVTAVRGEQFGSCFEISLPTA